MGSLAVISWLVLLASALSLLVRVSVGLGQEAVQAEGSKHWAQGTALGVSFFLLEEVKLVVVVKEVAFVGVAIQGIKEGGKGS